MKQKKINLKQIIKFALLVILAVILLILLWIPIKKILVRLYPDKTYEITFKESDYKAEGKNFYLSENRFSPKLGINYEINGDNYQEIAGTPINVVWDSINIFQKQKNVWLSISLKDNSTWQTEVICEKCSGDETSEAFDLDIGIIKNYTLADKIGQYNIYSRYPIDNPVPSINISEWITSNATKGQYIKYSEDLIDEKMLLRTDWEGVELNDKTLEIQQRIRGPHKFYVLLDKKIDLTIEKGDYNYTDGKDDIYISLYDFTGKEQIRSEIADDGIADKSKEKIEALIKKSIVSDLPYKGLYILSIDEKNINKYHNDFYIDYLKINTDKLVTHQDNINNFGGNSELYFINERPSQSYIKILQDWQRGYVYLNDKKNNTTTLYLDTSVRTQPFITDKGEYFLKIGETEKIIFGNIFSFTRESFFDPFIYHPNMTTEPDYIITDINYEVKDNWVTAKKQISPKLIETINSQSKVNFIFSNQKLNLVNEINRSLLEKNFTLEKKINNNLFFYLRKTKVSLSYDLSGLFVAPDIEKWFKYIFEQKGIILSSSSYYPDIITDDLDAVLISSDLSDLPLFKKIILEIE